MQQSPNNHSTTTPSEAIEDIGSAIIELQAWAGILAHICSSRVPVSKDEMSVVGNGIQHAAGCLDRTMYGVIHSWEVDKGAFAARERALLDDLERAEQAARDRATLLGINLGPYTKLAALAGEGGAK